MSNNISQPPTTDDQDAAALLMLFQSQSTAPAPAPAVQNNLKPALGDENKQTDDVPILPQSQNTSTKVESSSSTVLPVLDLSQQNASDLLENSVGPVQTDKKTPPSPRQVGEVQPVLEANSQDFNQLQPSQRPVLSNNSSGTNSTHSRSNSGTNFNTSPGPAAAALAVNNKKHDPKNPNNVKAMVAAAALAAAAATPFPLLSHDSRKEPEKKLQIDSSDPVKTELSEPPLQEKDNKQEDVENDTKQESVKDSVTNEDKSEAAVNKADVELDEADEIDKILEPSIETKDASPAQDELEKTPEESSYYTDPDSGTIGCVCEYDHDDGFTIQCDRCYRWQHASCMGIKSMDEVPEFYLCYLCDRSRKVNKAKAREAQRDFLMPTSKRKRLNSMDNETLRKEIVQQVTTIPEESNQEDESSRRKSSTTVSREKENQTPVNNNNNNRGRKPKPLPKKDLTTEAVDDSELFANSKDGYKTVYFPLSKSEFRDTNTKFLFEKLADLMESKRGKFSAITGYSSNELKRELGKSKVIVKPFGENVKMRFPGFSRFSVSIDNNAEEGDLIMDLVGEIQLKQDYIDHPFNHYNIWGVAKPKVFFIPDIPFVVDARYSGNEARFIRRSCTPSCEIKVLLLSNDNSIRFVVSPIRPLKSGQEITLPWVWDQSHPIHKIINGKTFDLLNDEEKPVLVRSVETVLNGCECACTNNNECYLYKVRKLLAYLYRSTRKINIPTFGNNLSKYADIYRQRDETYFVPIKHRLDERYQEIETDLSKARNAQPSAHQVLNGDQQKDHINDKNDFVLKTRKATLSDLPDDLLPYKYRILQNGTQEIKKIPETHDSESVSTTLSVESYPIPIPILKPMVMNRIPSSVSASIISSKTSISSSLISTDLQDNTTGVKPPIKKKMSLKDYMKSKKK